MSRPTVIESLEARQLFSTYTLSAVAALPAAPADALVLDGSGNLFGTTSNGGSFGSGSVYEIPAGSSTPVTLASFGGGSAGVTPIGPIAIDPSGSLFGVTAGGGSGGVGTIWKFAHGGSSVTTLASFDATTGSHPGHAGVTLDSAGNLYGATSGGGNTAGDGTVFELPSGGSTIHVLGVFGGAQSADPEGKLIVDSSGNVFGTSRGIGGAGDIFEIVAGSGVITSQVPSNLELANPSGVLVADASGNLYGVTEDGGGGGGTIFEKYGGVTQFNTLASFDDQRHPIDTGLVIDSAGNLFGTTANNPTNGNGTVWELRQGTSTPVTLATFDGSLGGTPTALISDNAGGFYGVTRTGSHSVYHLVRTASGPQPTMTAIQSSGDGTTTVHAITFFVSVTPPSPIDETPSGTVQFTANGVAIGTSELGVDGVTSFTTDLLPAGDNLVVAQYLGNTDSLASASSAVSVNVSIDSTSSFTDALMSDIPNQSLNGTPVGESGPDRWFVSGGDVFTYSASGVNRISGISSAGSGAAVARAFRLLGSASYSVSANLFPGNTAGTWAGVGFFNSPSDPSGGDPLYLRIKNTGAYELDATGSGSTPTVLASGTLNAQTWSTADAPRVSLVWNTAAGTVSASVNGIAVATDLSLAAVTGLDSSLVNSVGFAKQGSSDTSLSVTNFAFSSDSSLSTTPIGLGSINTDFGQQGRATNALGFTSLEAVAASGTTTLLLGNTASGFAVAQLGAAGSPVTSFGVNGIFRDAFAGQAGGAAALAVLSDGSFAIAGTAGSSFAFEHVSADGKTVLNTAVLPVNVSGATDVLHAMAVGSNGAIYLVGQADGNMLAAEVDSSGALVSGFGTGGFATVDFQGADVAYSAAVQTDGRLVLAGSSVDGNGVGSVAVARLNTNGSLDTHFGKRGLVSTSVRGVDDAATTAAIGPKNTILIGGYSASSAGSSDFLLVRYTARGAVDRSFGRGPMVTSFDQPSAVTSLAYTSDGLVVATGKTLNTLNGFSAGNDTNLAVAAYTARGALDAAFATAGTAIIDLGTNTLGSASSAELRRAFDTSGQGKSVVALDGLQVVGNSGDNTVATEFITRFLQFTPSFAAEPQLTAKAKQKLVTKVLLTNTGTGALVQDVSLSLSLSADGASIGSIFLTNTKIKLRLKPGQGKTVRVVSTVPAGLRGNYRTIISSSGFTILSSTATTITP